MANKTIAWTTGTGNITLTYQGQGDGSIQVDSDANTLGTARSQVITVKTGQGGIVTKNLTVRQAACPFPVGEIRNYAYSGSYQEVELPAGSYKLQCWGAQGGRNGTNSTYNITAKVGGKGGYAEGIITFSQKTTVRVYVGGQGSYNSGGFNGGGNSSDYSQYNSEGEFGFSKFGGGGGATDIRLSDGSLLSRMIVAGGGSGSAMAYKALTTMETVTTETIPSSQITSSGGCWSKTYNKWVVGSTYTMHNILVTGHRGETCTIKKGSRTIYYTFLQNTNTSPSFEESLSYATGYSTTETASNTDVIVTVPSNAGILSVWVHDGSGYYDVQSVTFTKQVSTTTISRDERDGFPGGGEIAGSWNTELAGTQIAAGTGGSFGQGANQTATDYRYCSAGGGGGWYGGGGGQKSNSAIATCKYSGGGSGWVNVAASAGNRPSGYTGLELDSGITTAGDQSFEAPGGGTETGHEGNGYARITRLA